MCWHTLFVIHYFGIYLVLCDLYLKRFDWTNVFVVWHFLLLFVTNCVVVIPAYWSFESFWPSLNWQTIKNWHFMHYRMIKGRIFCEKNAPKARFVMTQNAPQANPIKQNTPQANFPGWILMVFCLIGIVCKLIFTNHNSESCSFVID